MLLDLDLIITRGGRSSGKIESNFFSEALCDIFKLVGHAEEKDKREDKRVERQITKM